MKNPVRDGVITTFAVLLSFAALDDITTDNATSFILERTLLILAACWFVALAWQIVRSGNRAVGILSLAVAVAAAVAGLILVRDAALAKVEYIVSFAGMVWFTGIAGTFMWLGLRAPRNA